MTTPREYYLQDKPVETMDYDDPDCNYAKWPRDELDRRTLAAQTDFSEVGGVRPDAHYKAPDPFARHASDEWFDADLDHTSTGAHEVHREIKERFKVDYAAIAWVIAGGILLYGVLREAMQWYLIAKVLSP